MRWISAVLAAVAVVAATALLLFACSNKQAVNEAIERSTAPLLVPTGEWRDVFDFTAPPGSTDLYHVRWNFSAGATDVVSGWQVAPTADYQSAKIAEGPGEAVVLEVLRAANDTTCDVVDSATDIRMCSYPAEFVRGGANVYLVRDLDDLTLVIEYLNIDGERSDYNPESLDARYIAGPFDRVPIDGDIDDYLVYIY